jgi:cyclophilin family peptidyl-prolyl cis-trans isomerase/HEAT repeat protein
MKKIISICLFTLLIFSANALAQIPTQILVSISKAEDELRFDKTLENLLASKDAKTRTRATLAAGRISDEAAIPALINLLDKDSAAEVRTMAAFAIGEIESIKAADAILNVLKNTGNPDALRARATEAAGKIAAANAKDEKSKTLGEAILEVLEYENRRGKQQNRETVLLGLTAALRAKPDKTDLVVAKFLTNLDARVRADAANTMSRIRAKNANEQFRAMLLSDSDAIARANAARALGAAEDKDSFNILLETAIEDNDSRVRVSAIRSLGSLKEAKAADKLLERGEKLLADYKKSKFANPSEKSELLEIATVLGNVLIKAKHEKALKFLDEFIVADKLQSAEIPVARMKISQTKFDSNSYKNLTADETSLGFARTLFQLFGEVSNFDEAENKFRQETIMFLREILDEINEKAPPEKNVIPALPELLVSFAKFKTDDLDYTLRRYSSYQDTFVRAAAAELIGDLEPNKENISALVAAFPLSKNDKLNDAALATLDALEKQYKKLPSGDESRNSILKVFQTALESPDYLVRRKTVSILKSLQLTESVPQTFQRVRFPLNNNAPGEFRTVRADYVSAVSRKNGTVKAILTTEKGNFTIDLTPEDAPLTVDNFIRLAKSNYFNGLAIHRVVPNFVMQDGDPRGDGNGGPGWQIRCEINMLEYERGAVGMALSGKDTGGSQWFVTHSPQPHLDSGYTVFGRVNETDMKIVDNLVRGDKITSVKIVEGKLPVKKGK